MRMAGVVLIFIGLASGCLGVLGMLGEAGGEASPLTPLAAAPAANGLVRVQGRLHADAPVQMPDDGSTVLRGRIRVGLMKSRDRTPHEVLDEWSGDAPVVVITDGTSALPVAVETLPLREDRSARGTLTRTASRGGHPERAEYGGRTWELDPESYPADSWRLDIERALLAQDESVVATGRIVDGRLSPASGTELHIEYGTAEEVAEAHGRNQLVLACVGPLFLLLGLLLTVVASIQMAKARVAGAAAIGSMLGN